MAIRLRLYLGGSLSGTMENVDDGPVDRGGETYVPRAWPVPGRPGALVLLLTPTGMSNPEVTALMASEDAQQHWLADYDFPG